LLFVIPHRSQHLCRSGPADAASEGTCGVIEDLVPDVPHPLVGASSLIRHRDSQHLFEMSQNVLWRLKHRHSGHRGTTVDPVEQRVDVLASEPALGWLLRGRYF